MKMEWERKLNLMIVDHDPSCHRNDDESDDEYCHEHHYYYDDDGNEEMLNDV